MTGTTQDMIWQGVDEVTGLQFTRISDSKYTVESKSGGRPHALVCTPFGTWRCDCRGFLFHSGCTHCGIAFRQEKRYGQWQALLATPEPQPTPSATEDWWSVVEDEYSTVQAERLVAMFGAASQIGCPHSTRAANKAVREQEAREQEQRSGDYCDEWIEP